MTGTAVQAAFCGEIVDNEFPLTEVDKKPFLQVSGDTADLEDLLRRGREGDEKAFEALYRRYKDRVFRLAYRHTGNSAAAEDLLQDIFLNVFRSLDGVKQADTFSAWIYRVSLNACYSYLRGKKRRTQESVPLSSVEETAASPDDDAGGIRDGWTRTLDEAVRRLPKKLGRVFVLHDVEGFKHEEIARLLGCSVGTSKSQLFRARMKMRNMLKEKGFIKGGRS
jgi:RNA polymerase sigma-70 factor, ECF subfamily